MLLYCDCLNSCPLSKEEGYGACCQDAPNNIFARVADKFPYDLIKEESKRIFIAEKMAAFEEEMGEQYNGL